MVEGHVYENTLDFERLDCRKLTKVARNLLSRGKGYTGSAAPTEGAMPSTAAAPVGTIILVRGWSCSLGHPAFMQEKREEAKQEEEVKKEEKEEDDG